VRPFVQQLQLSVSPHARLHGVSSSSSCRRGPIALPLTGTATLTAAPNHSPAALSQREIGADRCGLPAAQGVKKSIAFSKTRFTWSALEHVGLSVKSADLVL